MADMVFACPCGRELDPDYVEGVLHGGVAASGHMVVISFRCECDPSRERHRRYWAAPQAVRKVTQDQGLPYRNPVPLLPVPPDHPDVLEWRRLIGRYGNDIGAFVAEFER